MVIVASIYLRFYIKVGVGVSTFLLTSTLTPPKFLLSLTLTPRLQLRLHRPAWCAECSDYIFKTWMSPHSVTALEYISSLCPNVSKFSIL
jgi:hypothetical protein